MKLNLGCGTDLKEGWVNLDISPSVGADVVHDLSKLPLPFPDEHFDEVLCNDILEHLADYPDVLRELHRILVYGGKIHIRVPHFSSLNNFVDPTHRRMFSVATFDFFVKGTKFSGARGYYFDFLFSRNISEHITFPSGGFLEKLVNKSRYRRGYYERTFLSRLYPAENIIVTLEK